eukprot:617180_1
MMALLSIAIFLFSTIQGQYITMWYDDMNAADSNGWTDTNDVTFGYTSGGCFNDLCVKTSAIDSTTSGIDKFTDITHYSAIQLQFDLCVNALEDGDTCRVYYAYDQRVNKIELAAFDAVDGERHYFPTQILDLPLSAVSTDLWIFLETTPKDVFVDDSGDYCYWDNVYLKGVPITTTPSKIPSYSPTRIPSKTPSTDPSTIPTETPSNDPSTMPSATPSNGPFAMPSEAPSTDPTSTIPTETPSTDPSTMPSTETPSTDPSTMPTETPSSFPSHIPSRSPITSSPSVIPSTNPSNNPSVFPSNRPSHVPSHMPSLRDIIASTSITIYKTSTLNKRDDKIRKNEEYDPYIIILVSVVLVTTVVIVIIGYHLYQHLKKDKRIAQGMKHSIGSKQVTATKESSDPTAPDIIQLTQTKAQVTYGSHVANESSTINAGLVMRGSVMMTQGNDMKRDLCDHGVCADDILAEEVPGVLENDTADMSDTDHDSLYISEEGREMDTPQGTTNDGEGSDGLAMEVFALNIGISVNKFIAGGFKNPEQIIEMIEKGKGKLFLDGGVLNIWELHCLTEYVENTKNSNIV